MWRSATVTTVGLGLGAMLMACSPSYPNCETDDHCAEKGEYCLNQTCQECRDDSHCVDKKGPKHECVSGRCEPYECKLDTECTDGLVCRGKQCVPECTDTADCPSGKKCEEQRCVDECQSDAECGAGQVCDNGACASASDNISDACRPMNPGSGEIIGLETVRFDFNSYDLNGTARRALDQNAQCLKQTPGVSVVVEGHCDERGTQEYNLALGEKRANTVRSYLRNLGVSDKSMRTRSKGENEPLCREASESCWDQNRRVEFIQKRSGGM